MKRAVLVLLVACGGEKQASAPPAPGSASAAKPADAITAKLAGCAPALSPPVDPRENAGAPTSTDNSARIVMKDPSVAGALTPLAIRSQLRRHMAKLKTCYETELLGKPALVGELEVAFAINSMGHVASATGSGVDPALAKCFADQVKNATFQPPPDGNNVQVTVRFDLQRSVRVTDVVQPATPRVLREWTPFASERVFGDAKATAIEVEAKVRERMAAVEHCFDGARGAIRAIVAIDGRGSVSTTRVGGIGDSEIESCLARAIGGFAVTPSSFAEVACDFTRGGDAPLRVSPDAGYTVIELTRTEVRNRSSVREIPPRGQHRSVTMLGGTATVLVVADPDAPAHGLEYALWWAPPGPTLVAVKASGGAPVVLGMGDSRAQRSAATMKRVVQLRTDDGAMRACVPGSELPDSASLLDPRAMDRVMQAVVAACAQSPCEPTIVVGTSGDFIAKELVATTSAARRAGFHAISIGGPACD